MLEFVILVVTLVISIAVREFQLHCQNWIQILVATSTEEKTFWNRKNNHGAIGFAFPFNSWTVSIRVEENLIGEVFLFESFMIFSVQLNFSKELPSIYACFLIGIADNFRIFLSSIEIVKVSHLNGHFGFYSNWRFRFQITDLSLSPSHYLFLSKKANFDVIISNLLINWYGFN